MYGGHSGGRGGGGRAGSEPAATEGASAVALKSQRAAGVNAVLHHALGARVQRIEEAWQAGRSLLIGGRSWSPSDSLLEKVHGCSVVSLVVEATRAPRDNDSLIHRLHLRQKYKPNFQKSQW